MATRTNFTRDSLNVWLALWGEVAANPALQAEHRKHYARYRATIARAIDDLARARGIVVDAQVLAISVIALIDGLWLEQGIDPDLLSPARSIAACCRLLEPILGPLPVAPQSDPRAAPQAPTKARRAAAAPIHRLYKPCGMADMQREHRLTAGKFPADM